MTATTRQLGIQTDIYDLKLIHASRYQIFIQEVAHRRIEYSYSLSSLSLSAIDSTIDRLSMILYLPTLPQRDIVLHHGAI
jgi:hypothetical protein